MIYPSIDSVFHPATETLCGVEMIIFVHWTQCLPREKLPLLTDVPTQLVGRRSNLLSGPVC